MSCLPTLLQSRTRRANLLINYRLAFSLRPCRRKVPLRCGIDHCCWIRFTPRAAHSLGEPWRTFQLVAMVTTLLCRECNSISGRLFPSLVLFASFTLLGIFISALGPAVPFLSRDLGVAETSFGAGFSLRGLGYLLGSWCSSLTWVLCLAVSC